MKECTRMKAVMAWSHLNYNMYYTQYIRVVIDELCTSMDLQPSVSDSRAHDTLHDTTEAVPISNSITAFLPP